MAGGGGKPAEPIPFPVARTTPPHTPGGFKELGTSEFACALGADDASLHGHWCGRCQGIWWGLALEAQCPACGQRGA